MTLYEYRAKLERVVDGDTYDFRVYNESGESLNAALIEEFDVGT